MADSETFSNKKSPKYVDLLDEDKKIAGQNFVCLSFVSPENIIKQKELYYFDEFIKKYGLSKSLEKFNGFLQFLSYKYKINFDKVSNDMKEFVKEEKEVLTSLSVYDDYKSFVDANEEQLDNDFNKHHIFQTSVRGIKIRGSFPTQEEAELRCRIIRELDPNHDVFVGPVGTWLPWDPDAYKTGRVEYMEETLNQLMNEKQKNESAAKLEFDKRLRETKRKAIEENIEKAKESGNVLTQTLDKAGNLVNIKDVNTTENAVLESGEIVTSEDIKKQLFEGDNVVMDKNTDHGLSQLVNNSSIKPIEEEAATTETEEEEVYHPVSNIEDND
jgi:hypothetical protein